MKPESTTEPPANAAIVTTDNLILVGPGYSLEIPDTAEKRKSALIVAAQAITEVTTPEQAEDASAEVKALAKIRNEIERSRNLVKAPVLALGKSIDERAKEFAAALDIEEKRLTRLISDHAMKVEVARRAAAAEAARLAAEKAEAERKAEAARLAEEKRREDEARKSREAAAAAKDAEEAAAAAAAADDEEDIEAEIARAAAIDAKNAADKAAKEAEEAARLAEEDRRYFAAKLAEEQRLVSVAATQQTKGVTFPLSFEVDDIAQLYMEHPELVTLTVKTAEVKAFLKAEETKLNGQVPTVPGLRVFRAARIQTR